MAAGSLTPQAPWIRELVFITAGGPPTGPCNGIDIEGSYPSSLIVKGATRPVAGTFYVTINAISALLIESTSLMTFGTSPTAPTLRGPPSGAGVDQTATDLQLAVGRGTGAAINRTVRLQANVVAASGAANQTVRDVGRFADNHVELLTNNTTRIDINNAGVVETTGTFVSSLNDAGAPSFPPPMLIRLLHTATGAVPPGMGAGLYFTLENSVGANIDAAVWGAFWASPVAGAENSVAALYTRSGGVQQTILYCYYTGTEALLQFPNSIQGAVEAQSDGVSNATLTLRATGTAGSIVRIVTDGGTYLQTTSTSELLLPRTTLTLGTTPTTTLLRAAPSGAGVDQAATELDLAVGRGTGAAVNKAVKIQANVVTASGAANQVIRDVATFADNATQILTGNSVRLETSATLVRARVAASPAASGNLNVLAVQGDQSQAGTIGDTDTLYFEQRNGSNTITTFAQVASEITDATASAEYGAVVASCLDAGTMVEQGRFTTDISFGFAARGISFPPVDASLSEIASIVCNGDGINQNELYINARTPLGKTSMVIDDIILATFSGLECEFNSVAIVSILGLFKLEFGDTTAITGDAVSNTIMGISKIAGAASTITITNSKVSANSCVFACLAQNNATALGVKDTEVAGGGGSFVIRTNGNTTGTCNVFWVVITPS